MKDVQTILQGAKLPAAPSPLTDQQKDSVSFFFMRLKLVYGPLYDSAIPDPHTEKFARREYGKHVANMTREQISKGFDLLHRLKQGAEREKWRYMDIDGVIGLIKHGDDGGSIDWEHRRIIEADRERRAERMLPDLGKQERARKAGEAALSELCAKLGVKRHAKP